MKIQLARRNYFIITGFIFYFISSCSNNAGAFTLKERSLVQDSVRLMAESIAKDVSHDGPVAWLRYFESTPDFFMASDGQLVFPNIDTATGFINNILVKSISKIELHWSNIRVDPLTAELASISAIFHEDIKDAAGKTTPGDGYFTGIAHQTSQGWKLHNAHWSSIVAH
jgi:SnoaL-like domain